MFPVVKKGTEFLARPEVSTPLIQHFSYKPETCLLNNSQNSSPLAITAVIGLSATYRDSADSLESRASFVWSNEISFVNFILSLYCNGLILSWKFVRTFTNLQLQITNPQALD